MKSQNNLIITGNVISVISAPPITRFTIVHFFGKKKPPLFLWCVTNVNVENTIEKGDKVCISAYIRPRKNGIEAYAKEFISIEKRSNYDHSSS